MSKNVSDEIIQKQHTDKITATFASCEQVGKISQHINDITMALTVPREYNRILELLQTIDKHIIDPAIFFAKNEIYKAVNKVSNEVKQDIKKELRKGKNILASSQSKEDLKEEILFVARKLDAVSKLRMLNPKDTKERLEKIMGPSNSNKFLDSADKVCQVGKILTEISHTLKSSFFDPHRSGKDYRQLTKCLEKNTVNLTTKLIHHIHLLQDNNKWEEAISVATKWLESVEQNPAIFKLIGSIYDQKTNGIDLSNLEPIIKEYYLSLIKNSSYYYLEGFARQKKEVTLDHCKILLKVAEKSGKLKIPDANEVAIKTLKEALKYAVELDEDIYVKHITALINNIENNNANQNDQLYDTFVGTDNQPLSTPRLYPEIFDEPEEKLGSLNQNLFPGVPTSPIPAARTLLPYPLATPTPTPDQENKSLAASIIAQDNVNGNFLPDETIGRKFILPIVKQISILDKLTLSEKKIPLKLGVALIREAMQGLKKSEADVVTMLRPFLLEQEQNIQELLAYKHTIELAQTQPMGESSTISDQI